MVCKAIDMADNGAYTVDDLMSGQKYKRTNFDDDDASLGGTPPGVTYDPAIAFKAGASFWQKRSLLEKILLFFVVALGITAIVLGAILGSKKPEVRIETKFKEKALCTSKACVTVASSILNAIDETVDPCEDFYNYACGGWVRNHPIPSGQSRWGTFGVMWRDNQIVLKIALEKPDNETVSRSVAERKARRYYTSCMDPNKTVEALGAQPLMDLLTQLGGWNISSSSGQWRADRWSFMNTLQKVHSLGLSTFFNAWVGEDEKDPEKNILQFDQSGLGLARDQYLNKTITEDKVLTAYLKFMTDISVLLGGDFNATEEQMLKVIEFEQAIANITTPQEDRRDDEKLYHKMTIGDLQQIAPFVAWKDYANQLLNVTTYRVDETEPVLVYAPEFLGNMSVLVTEMQKTAEGNNTLNNYIMWHTVKLMCAYLSKPFQDAKKEFLKVITGVSGDEELWRYCTTDTDNILGFAVGAMFVREAFHGSSKKNAEEMIQDIKRAFKTNLPTLNWMDSETQKAAVEKANAVVDMIGFPAYIQNATLLDDRYRLLDVKVEDYFGNNINALKYNMERNLNKLRKKPDKMSWSMTPPTVNAYYTPTKNEIVFPAGILQAPFYDKAYPRSVNFGGMGVVMGHELTHGFDDQGREYDKSGILRPWWKKAAVDRFKERTECMVDQYSKFKLNGENIRGKQTLGENIADNGGLKAAYMAYNYYVRHNGAELPLPGLSLTHSQLFFVAFAQVWCSNSKPEADHMSILLDPHSPSKFRVIGPLSNSREFAEQFKCKPGARMNPVDKCIVW